MCLRLASVLFLVVLAILAVFLVALAVLAVVPAEAASEGDLRLTGDAAVSIARDNAAMSGSAPFTTVPHASRPTIGR